MLRNSALATFLVTASFSLVFFSGCAEKNADGTTKKKERILPPSSGTHSELLLVMPDALWEGAPGKEFRALYLADVELLLERALKDDVAGGAHFHVAVLPGGPLGGMAGQ